VIAGTYSGFLLFEKKNGEWVFSRKIGGFDESSRDFFWGEDGSIWMSHGLKGIFRIDLNEGLDSVTRVSFYNSNNGLPSDYGMTLFRFRDSLYITTPEGIFRHDGSNGHFRGSTLMTSILGKRFYRKITLDQSGNIWYFVDSEAGVLRLQEDGSFLDITVPFEPISNSFIGGFEFVYPHDPGNVFFGTENGFVHYDPSFTKDYNKTLIAYIRDVSSSSMDSLLFSGMTDGTFTLTESIAFKNNDVQFFFSANDFENPDRVEYSTYLSNLETGWSAWSLQSNREFTNLTEGDYVFKVKARNLYHVESDPVTFFFRVNPPWRRSLPAYILYAALFLMASYAGLLLVRRKIRRSKLEAEKAKDRQFRQREEELEKASLEAEKEVIRLRNEKLREEMKLKDMELANSTLQMIQKNKLLVNLKDDLKKLTSSTRDEEARAQVRLLMRKINKDIDTDSQWKVFETQFEKVHEEFLHRIKADFPELTPRELKLCAYLRLNISSKEIALLMNISTRGVEISRYRLRKKLNLPHDTNLTDFIISF
jgi:hypothetical protein